MIENIGIVANIVSAITLIVLGIRKKVLTILILGIVVLLGTLMSGWPTIKEGFIAASSQ